MFKQQNMDLLTVLVIVRLEKEFFSLVLITTCVKINKLTNNDKLFVVLTHIGWRLPDFDAVKDMILASSFVSFLDLVFACLLHISSIQTATDKESSESLIVAS